MLAIAMAWVVILAAPVALRAAAPLINFIRKRTR